MTRREFVRALSLTLPTCAFAGASLPTLCTCAADALSRTTVFTDDLHRAVRMPASLPRQSVMFMDLPAEQLVCAVSPEHAYALISALPVSGSRSSLFPESVRDVRTMPPAVMTSGALDQLAGIATDGVELIVGTFSSELGASELRALEADMLQDALGVPVACLSSSLSSLPVSFRKTAYLLGSGNAGEPAARYCEDVLMHVGEFARGLADGNDERAQILVTTGESVNASVASFLPQMGGIEALALCGAANAAPEPTIDESKLAEARTLAAQAVQAAREGGVSGFRKAADDIAAAYSAAWNRADGSQDIAPALRSSTQVGTIDTSNNRTIRPTRILTTSANANAVVFGIGGGTSAQAAVTSVPNAPYPWLTGTGSVMDILGMQWAASLLYPDACPWDASAAAREFFSSVFGVDAGESQLADMLGAQ